MGTLLSVLGILNGIKTMQSGNKVAGGMNVLNSFSNFMR